MGSDGSKTAPWATRLISIHAPRMGSDLRFVPYGHATFISIHAPRMGSDLRRGYRRDAERVISIHAPRMGSDHNGVSDAACRSYFNPRSPDGERQVATSKFGQFLRISIHAPRMGSDRENGHLRPRYGQNHPFSTLIVSQIVVDVLGTVRKSQKHQRTSHYEVIKQPERQK